MNAPYFHVFVGVGFSALHAGHLAIGRRVLIFIGLDACGLMFLHIFDED